MDNQLNDLKEEIKELRKENVKIKLKLESLSDFIYDCFERLGVKLDKGVNNLKPKRRNKRRNLYKFERMKILLFSKIILYKHIYI